MEQEKINGAIKAIKLEIENRKTQKKALKKNQYELRDHCQKIIDNLETALMIVNEYSRLTYCKECNFWNTEACQMTCYDDEEHSECSETSKFLLTYTARDKSEEVGGYQWANTEEDLRFYAAEFKEEIGDKFVLEDAIEVLKYRDIEID